MIAPYPHLLSSTPSYTCYSDSTTSQPSSNQSGLSKNSRTKTLENSRIMDPSYFSGTSACGLSNGYPYYVDAEGYLHDSDYRPFPLISSAPNSHFNHGEFRNILVPSDRLALRRFKTSPPRPSFPQVPYWETFGFSQQEDSDEEDFAEPSKKVSFHSWPVHTVERQGYAYRSYVEQSDQYKSGSRVIVDEHTGRSALVKDKNQAVNDALGNVKDEDREDDGDQERLQAAGETQDDKEGKRVASPAESLQQKWVTTKLGMQLNMIRIQQRVKEHLQRKSNQLGGL